jgi:hypothetical protein
VDVEGDAKMKKLFILLCVLIFTSCQLKISSRPSTVEEDYLITPYNSSVLLDRWADKQLNQEVAIYSWEKDGHSYLVFLMDGTESGAMQVLEVKR